MQYFQQGLIPYTEDRDVRLYLALDKSHRDFLEEVRQFIVEDGNTPITFIDDSVYRVAPHTYPYPKEYYDIWEVELMLPIYNDNSDKESKLYELYAARRYGLFPEWAEFHYATNTSWDELYEKFENYMNSKIKQLQQH